MVGEENGWVGEELALAGLTQAESRERLGRILGMRGVERWDDEMDEVVGGLEGAGQILLGLTQAESIKVNFWALNF